MSRNQGGVGTRVCKQGAILQRFREGAVNALFSTSVAEEGLDVQDCSIVICYDVPKRPLSMVQTMGRARARFSEVYFMQPVQPWDNALPDVCCCSLMCCMIAVSASVLLGPHLCITPLIYTVQLCLYFCLLLTASLYQCCRLASCRHTQCVATCCQFWPVHFVITCFYQTPHHRHHMHAALYQEDGGVQPCDEDCSGAVGRG